MLFPSRQLALLTCACLILLGATAGAAGPGVGSTEKPTAATTLAAELFGSSITKATASYEASSPGAGRRQGRPTVHVAAARPMARLAVSIEGRRIGMLATNMLGNGSLVVESPRVPNVKGGHTVIFGSLCGVFFDMAPDMRRRMQRYHVHADLFGATHASGFVKYDESFTRDRLTRAVSIEVVNADPETTYDVTVDGRRAAQIKTNEHGFGTLTMYTNGPHPMPRLFPTLVPGAKVVAGPVTGTVRR